MKLVNPANKRKYSVIVVGSGLAGACGRRLAGRARLQRQASSATRTARAAPTRIAAQGGINAAKNYQNDGDSVYRLFYDTVKGGDFRAREANVYRLAEVSVNIIDQCVAQGVPFAREYGGMLDNRSFGGAQVSRTFYARGQTGQQLLLGAYQALERQIGAGHGEDVPAHRDARPGRRSTAGRAASSRATWSPARSSRTSADAVVLRHRRLRQRLLPLDQRQGLQRHGHLARLQAGRALRQPLLHADPPDLHPRQRASTSRKLTLMSESLRNDGRIWVPRRRRRQARRRTRSPRTSATTTWSGSTRASATWPRATSPRAPPSRSATRAAAWAPAGSASTSTSPTPSSGSGERSHRENATATSSTCTSASPARTPTRSPMRIYPAVHYTMGGLWVDYNLMSTIPGLFVLGEANFSDHGANRLGASALMQGLADGYFVLPYTIGDYLACDQARTRSDRATPTFKEAEAEVDERMQAAARHARASAPSTSFHRELGKIMWDYCGMARNDGGPASRRCSRSPSCARSSGRTCSVPGERRRPQPGAREGRPRGRLPRARRAACACDALRPRGVLRRPLPRGVPDGGGRGQCATTRTSATSRPGSTPAGRARHAESWHNEPLRLRDTSSLRARGATSNRRQLEL